MSEPDPITVLPANQEMFCREYCADPERNATECAKRAGYSHKTAHSQASRLLKNVKIKARIAELTAPKLEALDISADRILRRLAELAFVRVGDLIHVTDDGDPYLDFTKMTDAHRAALTSAELEDFVDRRERDADGEVIARDVRRVKGKFADPLKALELLMKQAGMLREQIDVTVKGDFATDLLKARKRAKEGRA